MGFFKKSIPTQSKRNALTIIAHGNKISGDLAITGKLHIDGVIDGAITSIENISIGKTGVVKGKIKAKDITVSGLLEGDVMCQHLHIEAGGRVVAAVTSVDLTMDMKSQFIGERKESSLTQIEKARDLPLKEGDTLDIVSDIPDKISLPSTAKDRRKPSTVSAITKSSMNLEAKNSELDLELAALAKEKDKSTLELKDSNAKEAPVSAEAEKKEKKSKKARGAAAGTAKPKVADENTTIVEINV